MYSNLYICIPTYVQRKRKEKECVYAQLGSVFVVCPKEKMNEKSVCVPELGSIYIAKEVTNVDRKYVVCVCGEVSYPTTMNDGRTWGKREVGKGRPVVYNKTI